MTPLTLLAIIGVGALVGGPIVISWVGRGWVSKYDSAPYTFQHIPPQNGKVAVVTGGNTGIGKVTVRELARKGAHVIMGVRSLERGESAKKDICSEIAPSPCNVEVWKLDLSSLASVDAFASKYLQEGPSGLDMLILNAGVMMCPHEETADGIEMQFGTNHLGHFFLTKLLLPVVESSKGRIVTVSSNASRYPYSGGIHFDQLTSNKNYDMAQAYGQSKLANILFTYELARRLQEQRSLVTANVLHPGFIATDLMRHLDKTYASFGAVGTLVGKWVEKWLLTAAMSADDGALTQLYVATAPELAYVTGQFFVPIAIRSTPGGWADDRGLQTKLWEESERLIEERYLSKKAK